MTNGLATCKCAAEKWLLSDYTACKTCPTEGVCDGSATWKCKTDAWEKDTEDDKATKCTEKCTAANNGEMLKWTTACECPDGKSSLGATIDKDVKCKDCPANSKSAALSVACKCEDTYKPDWTKDDATSCTIKIGTN